MKIEGLILSGGRSSRMGGFPKALCAFNDEYNFLSKIFFSMKSSGIDSISIITGCHHDGISKYCIKNLTEINIIYNDDWKLGMLSSIQKFIKFVSEKNFFIDGFVMIPVDHPFPNQTTYKRILSNASKDKIIIPKFQGKKGHPVFFGANFFDNLMEADHNIGARQVSRENSDKIFFINSNDSGILKDIDTREEYKRYVLNRKDKS